MFLLTSSDNSCFIWFMCKQNQTTDIGTLYVILSWLSPGGISIWPGSRYVYDIFVE